MEATNCGAGVRSVSYGPHGGVRPCPMFPSHVSLDADNLRETANALESLDAPSPVLCLDCANMYYCKGCFLRGYMKWKSFGDEGCRWSREKNIKRIFNFMEISKRD